MRNEATKRHHSGLVLPAYQIETLEVIAYQMGVPKSLVGEAAIRYGLEHYGELDEYIAELIGERQDNPSAFASLPRRHNTLYFTAEAKKQRLVTEKF